MRKLFTMLILLFLWAGSSWAQGTVNMYSFAGSSGSYTALSTETVLWSATFDDNNSTAITIPSFSVNSVAYTTMFVQANGWITLGGTSIASSYVPISNTTSYPVVISAFGRDLNNAAVGTPKISYNTNDGGDIVVQYQDVRRYNIAGEQLSFQIRLTPATGVIRFVYGGTISSGISTSYPQVGLRGATNTVYNNRTSTTTWSGTTAGGTNAATITYSSTVLPTAGQTYTFTPPVACTNPTNQPTALLLTPSTTSVAGTFTAAAGSDSYLVIRTPDGIPTATPVNGTTYAVGAALGNATVVQSSAALSFTASTLTAGTLYYFHVFSMNSLCSGGPLYLTTSPLTASTTTAPNPPASIAAAAVSGAQIDLTTIANVAGNDIMIAWNTVNTFGTPTGTYNSGDPITGGGTVLNTGAAGVSSHTGLTQGTQYYYRAWSVAGGLYSSSNVNANAITLCSAAYPAPFTQNFDALQDPDACWTETNGVLADPVVTTGVVSNWAKDDWRNITGSDKAAKLNIWSTGLYAWLFTPQIDLGTGTYQLEFDLSLNAYGTSTAPGTTGTDDKFAVVISTDGGTTWTSANTLRLWDNAGSSNVYNNINFNGERIVISLAGYSGVVKIGFYGESTVSNADNDLMINNLAIVPPPSCSIPLSLAYSGVTASTANISWTDAATVEIDYAIGAHTPGTGTIVPNVTANPYGLTGLTSNSTYYVYVRQNCGAGNFSAWTGPVVFTTLCDVTTSFTENFDAVTTPALPSCWAKVGAGGSASTQASNSSSAPNCLYIYSGSATSMAVVSMPGLSNAGDDTHQLKFKARANFTVGGIIEVGYLTNPLDAATFVSVQSFTIGALTYSDYIAILGTAPGANQVLAFRHTGVPANSVLIDDVTWELQPACAQVSALTATSITGSSAVLGWNANGTTAWEIEYGASGFTQGTGTMITAGVTNPYTLSGLTPVTAYSYYVRANCGVDGYSLWTGPYTFTTTVACPAPTAQVVTGIATDEAYLGWTSLGSLWNIEYGPAGFVQGTGTVISSNTNPKRISGLTAATAYSWYVQQDCGGGTLSTWTGPNTFTTLCDPIATLPWTENFDAVVTPALPSCWFEENGDWVTATNAGSTYDADALSGTQFLREAYSAVNEYIWSPGFTLTSGASYDFSFWWAGDNYAGWDGDVFYNTTPISTGATQMGASFVTAATVTSTTYAKVTRTLVPAVTGTYYFAIRVNATGDPWYLSFDDFKLDLTPSCVEPTGIAVSAITATTATIGWTAPSPAPGSGYQWEVRTSGAGGSGATGLVQSGSTSAGTVTANVAGLTATTTYYVYVRGNCGAGSYSTWAGPEDFRTGCSGGAISTFPYTEDFTAGIVPPDCWSEIISNPDYNWKPSTTNPGTADIEYDPDLVAQDEWLVTPVLNFSALAHPRLSFSWMMSYYWGVDPNDNYDLNCKISTDGGATWPTTLWSEAGEGVFTNFTMYTETIDLLAYAGQSNVKIAWQYVGVDGAQAGLDNIVIDLWPSCLAPSDVIASAVTTSTATISWTASPSAPTGGYEYEVRTSGAAGSGATGLFVAGTTAAGDVDANITGLTAATEYFVYVRSNCGAGDYSSWASGTFSTLCDAYALPFTEEFEATSATLGCWFSYNIDLAGTAWGLSSSYNHTTGGSVSAYHTYGPSTNTEDGYLVSPGLVIPASGNIELSFWSYNSFPTYYYKNSVMVSTGSPDPTDGDYVEIWTPGSVTATWEQALLDLSAYHGQTIYVAFRYEGSDAHAWYVDDVSVSTVVPSTKTLNLTNVLLEGLYDGAGTMRQAFDDLGPKFDPGVADMITVELHNAADYSTIEHTALVQLSTTGTATVTGIPASLSDSYYITVKHRNSIETTTANAVSFAGTTITQSFGDPAEIAGGNLLLMIDMGYAIYGGDINQDGFVDGGDVTPFDNDQFNFVAGYVDSDVDGNGSVDGGDGTILDNNQFNFVGAVLH